MTATAGRIAAELAALDDTVAMTGPDDLTPAVPGPRHADDIDGPHLPATPEEWDGFVITDDTTLSRMLRALRSIRRQRDRVRAMVQPELDRLEAWATAQDAPLRDRADRLEAAVKDYALSRRTATGGRARSIGTPFGSVTTRLAGGGWEVADLDAVLAWAKGTAPALVKVTEVLSKADANRAFTVTDDGDVVDKATGVLVPGVKARPKSLSASVSLEAAEPDDDGGQAAQDGGGR